MGLFGKRKSDRKVVILMMDRDYSGGLRDIIEEMTDGKRQYAVEGVCNNFVKLLYGERLSNYRAKNIRGVFPNHWDAPLYREQDPHMEEIARNCANEYIRKNLPGADAAATILSIDTFPGKPFAGIFIEY